MSNIVIEKVDFTNMFSYGADNSIKLNRNNITQLSAVNGSGKTSISLIIQELLFNKNIKGIKKGDILNRWGNSKTWSGSISFSVDNKSYIVNVSRTGASGKVQLLENGIDISEHKVLDTYKKIQEILGLDFEIFSQLTYQSSTDLLEFLKATDTNRKKFLINLFNLEKYMVIGEKIKLKAGEIDRDINELQGELKSVESFLNSTAIPTYMSEIPEPRVDSLLAMKIKSIDEQIANINETCKQIDKNNLYKKELNTLKFDISLREPEPFEKSDVLQTLKLDLVMLKNNIQTHKKEIKGLRIEDNCPACGQPIDNSHIIKIQQDLQTKIDKDTAAYTKNLELYEQLEAEFNEYTKLKKQYELNKQQISRFEQLSQLVNNSMPSEYPDAAKLLEEQKTLRTTLHKQETDRQKVIEYNKKVSANNSRVDALREQKAEFLIRQQELSNDIMVKSNQASSLAILKKAFSPSGIVAFKLENLTKELESNINYYLSQLSDGQFQIEFSLEKEKLNIDVINNGISSPIETVSGGEFSRIQTSILLAIRNLLSKLGGSSINLLFLDEITGVLDAEGKEKLVEVLQREDNLNVFLISHDFTHPLIDRVTIVKENNISTIYDS